MLVVCYKIKPHFRPLKALSSATELKSPVLLQLLYSLISMMAGVTRILTLICVAGCHLSSASPVPRSALVVQAGRNVSLTCNLTSSGQITWFLLRSDQLLPLLTVTLSKVKEVTVNCHTADKKRFASRGDVERGPVALEIQEVEEEDAGLYFCTGRGGETVRVNGGILLVVDGVGGESAGQPQWIPGIFVLPALLVLCLVFIVFIVGFGLRSGKPAVCCRPSPERSEPGPGGREEASLHYSSLKHADKPRPSSRGMTGLVKEDVIYSSVANHWNPNGSHDHR